MGLADYLTIGALVLNFFALLFAGYQTLASRKALGTARESIDLTRTSRYLEYLPEAGWIIQVNVSLERWRSDLQSSVELLAQSTKEKMVKFFAKLPPTPVKPPLV